jgi:hypothetical protein
MLLLVLELDGGSNITLLGKKRVYTNKSMVETCCEIYYIKGKVHNLFISYYSFKRESSIDLN